MFSSCCSLHTSNSYRITTKKHFVWIFQIHCWFKIKNFHSNSFCTLGRCLMYHNHILATVLSFFSQSYCKAAHWFLRISSVQINLNFTLNTGRYLNMSCFENLKSQFVSCSINRTGKLVDLQIICKYRGLFQPMLLVTAPIAFRFLLSLPISPHKQGCK